MIQLSIITVYLYMDHREDPIRCNHSGPEWTKEQWQWMGILHSPKFQHYWNFIIRLFRVICRTHMGGCREVVGVFYSPSRLGTYFSGWQPWSMLTSVKRLCLSLPLKIHKVTWAFLRFCLVWVYSDFFPKFVWSPPSLPWFPAPLWLGVLIVFRVPSTREKCSL